MSRSRDLASAYTGFDTWELDTTSTEDDDPIVNWSRADWTGFDKQGTGLSETSLNSGIFYFPQIGYWRIDYMIYAKEVSHHDFATYVNIYHFPDVSSTGTSNLIGRIAIPMFQHDYENTTSGFTSIKVSTSGSSGQGFKLTSSNTSGSNEIIGGGEGDTRFSVTRISGV